MRQPPASNGYRDSWCGELQRSSASRVVRVAGWVHRRRDHGGVVFIDLRDRSGIVQLVFHPERAEAHAAAHALRSEFVLSAHGTVVPRAAQNINPNLPTGEIEIDVSDMQVLAEALTPQFPVDEETPVEELIRLRHRPLDLRRASMRDALILRHELVAEIRSVLHDRDFLEIETPILTRSTPEGARDFLVPSRLTQGAWYALPQSPQLFKQLLIIGGYERYFQIARCFRDEDLRADRQPEFTQLDMEMGFVDEDDVIATTEAVMTAVFERAGLALPAPPWPRMSYDHALLRYGVDRPDTRFGLEIQEVGAALATTEFKVFAGALASGGVIRGINAGRCELARRDLDELTDLARVHGAKGLVWAFVEEDGSWRSPIAKFLSDEERTAVTELLAGNPGDLLFIVADASKIVAAALGALRLELAQRLNVIPENTHSIVWVVEFPMFEWDQTNGRWDPLHHPFTSPSAIENVQQLQAGEPGEMRSRAYDLVLDGVEIGGGSIRIHDRGVQLAVLRLLGIDEHEAQARFGFLLEALQYGAPPHGGIALGIDRIVTLCAGRDSIREVIAFPKTASGLDPLTGAPAEVSDEQLRELAIRPNTPTAG